MYVIFFSCKGILQVSFHKKGKKLTFLQPQFVQTGSKLSLFSYCNNAELLKVHILRSSVPGVSAQSTILRIKYQRLECVQYNSVYRVSSSGYDPSPPPIKLGVCEWEAKFHKVRAFVSAMVFSVPLEIFLDFHMIHVSTLSL